MSILHGTKRIGGAAVCAALVLTGCEFLDPTEVTNPNTTTDDLANAAEPTAALLPGLRAQMARATGAVVVTTGIVSDDFEITFTNITGELNEPHTVAPDGGSYNSTGGIGAYWNLQELRAFADFVIDTIAPQDDAATDAQLAEARYYRGMAYLMQGENWIAVPNRPDSEPLPWEELLQLAEQDFTQALGMGPSSELEAALQAALARVHRGLGNAADARSHAEAALALDPEFVHRQPYSAGEIEHPTFGNDRSYEPLPRLDFLDPKADGRDTPVPLAKAEEMHLILAEVAMLGDEYGAAAGHLGDAVELASTRPTGEAVDNDQRLNPDLTVRPRDSEILVRADEDSPYRAGLVLDRPGPVEVPLISGTSLDADSVRALTDPAELRHTLWLARQEILFLEGRRVHDLGVRLPITAREIDASPAIERGDPETSVQVPSYIPGSGAVNEFSPRSPYEDATGGENLATNEITIAVDLNRILAEERVSPLGTLP